MFEMRNNILTDRLSLDLLRSEDYEFIIQLVNSKGWIDFIGDRNVHSKEQALAYINKILTTPNMYYWVVRIKDGGVPGGIISFLKRDYLESFDIGFAFLSEFTGKGYAYEAAKEILSIVSEHPGYYPVLATTMPANVSSVKLLLKLGLYFEKELEVEKEKLHIYTNSTKIKQ
jgi:[ribosomal protein S5]-alanine N-acetyltransferase